MKRKNKIKYKPKEYNLTTMVVNIEKYFGRIKDTTIRTQEDKRRFYRWPYISR